MRKVLLIIIIALIAMYPFVIYFGLHYLSPRYLAVIIVLFFIVRFLLLQRGEFSLSKLATVLITGLGIALCFWAMISNNELTIRLYPVVINSVFFMVFIYSWFFPPSIIERLARITTPNLPPQAVSYTRNVTLVWSAFFVINASIALFTALFCRLKVWTFYNGFLSYLLIAVLFLIELVIRKMVQKRIASDV